MKRNEPIRKVKDIFGAHKAKPVVYDGEDYPSLEALARDLRMSPQLLRYHMKKGNEVGGCCIDYAF